MQADNLASESPAIDIPVIDLTPLTSGKGTAEQKEELGRQVRVACQEYGVFYVTGHGIPDAELQTAFQTSKEFFSLPQTAKRKVPFISGGFTRGYIGIGEESGSDMFEAKEAFSYGFDWNPQEPPTNPLQGPNQWPEPQPGLGSEWRQRMIKYYEQNCRVASVLTAALALALNLQDTAFDELCKGGDSISLMRLFHYLPRTAKESKESRNLGRSVTGSSPHTDWGWLTIILQDPAVVALELKQGDSWFSIPPKPGTLQGPNEWPLLVNIGDYVALMTGGEFVSPLHRVISSDQERFSFVFFSYPAYHAKLPSVRVDGQAELSLLKDQSFRSEQDALDSNDEVPEFGAFISQKWEQVQRKMS